MSEKHELIRKMIQMQREFIAQEQQGGIEQKDYFLPENNQSLSGYRESYAKVAARVIDLAHEEKGSRR